MRVEQGLLYIHDARISLLEHSPDYPPSERRFSRRLPFPSDLSSGRGMFESCFHRIPTLFSALCATSPESFMALHLFEFMALLGVGLVARDPDGPVAWLSTAAAAAAAERTSVPSPWRGWERAIEL